MKNIKLNLICAFLVINSFNCFHKTEVSKKEELIYNLSIPDLMTNKSSVLNDYDVSNVSSSSIIKFSGKITPSIKDEVVTTSIKNPFYYNEDFAYHYFSNLDKNMIANNDGICGYVAFIMYLSYLDTYWNDNIIPEIYDSSNNDISNTDNSETCVLSLDDYVYESPGVIDNLNSVGKRLTYIGKYIKDYKDVFYEQYSDTQKALIEKGALEYINANIESKSILGKLFEINLNNKVIQPKSLGGSNYIYGLGVSYDVELNTINGYLNYMNLTDKIEVISCNVDANNVSRSVIKKNIITLLKQGIPLIVGGEYKGDEGGGHVCIAYDYNQDTGAIIGNCGWKGQNASKSNLNNYLDYTDYYYLKPKDTYYHSHSNNYEYNSNKICSCKLSDHVHNYKYNVYTDTHDVKCICMDSQKNLTHNYIKTESKNGKEYAICECGYSKDITSSYSHTY